MNKCLFTQKRFFGFFLEHIYIAKGDWRSDSIQFVFLFFLILQVDNPWGLNSFPSIFCLAGHTNPSLNQAPEDWIRLDMCTPVYNSKIITSLKQGNMYSTRNFVYKVKITVTTTLLVMHKCVTQCVTQIQHVTINQTWQLCLQNLAAVQWAL